jgi:hypothetical protein
VSPAMAAITAISSKPSPLRNGRSRWIMLGYSWPGWPSWGSNWKYWKRRDTILYIYTSKKINGCLQLVFFLCAHCTHHPPDFVGLFMSVSGNETPSSGSMESLDRNSALFTSQNERVFGWRHWPTAICRAMLWEARSWLDLIQASIEIGFVHMYAWIHI